MDTQVLCMRLVRAESEEEVIRILEEGGYWNNESYGAPMVTKRTTGVQ